MIDSEKEQSYESRHEVSGDEEHRDTKQISEHEPSDKSQGSDHEQQTSDGEENSPRVKEVSGTKTISEDEEQSSTK